LTVRAEGLVYLGEWSTRRTVIRFEFAERRFEFTVKGEYNVDLTLALHDVNSGPHDLTGRDGACLVNEWSRGAQFKKLAGR
jgi:hypothetical protein